MNLIRSLHEECTSNWNDMCGSLRANLRALSKTLKFISLRDSQVKLSSFEHVMMEAQKTKVVLFGEHHHEPQILKAQLCILEGMASQVQKQDSNLVVVVEMFNFQQQGLLDAYHKREITLNELQQKYKHTEGFSVINHYGYILETARSFGIRVIAGFVPRPLGRTIINEGKEYTLKMIDEMGGPSKDFYIDGSESHYRYFQGLISGNMMDVVDKYRKIFPSQILKDSFFAHTVTNIIETSDNVKVLALCGSGHMDYGYGVPERIPSHIPRILITSRMKEDPIEKDVAHFIYQY